MPTEFAFATGAIQLSTGTQYVAFLNAIFDGSGNGASMPDSSGFGNVDYYAGGKFESLDNGNDLTQLTTRSWFSFQSGADVWFKASFSATAVPEPSSVILFGFAFTGLAFSRVRIRATTPSKR